MKIPNVDEDVKKQEFSYCLWEYKLVRIPWKNIWQNLAKPRKHIFWTNNYIYSYIFYRNFDKGVPRHMNICVKNS